MTTYVYIVLVVSISTVLAAELNSPCVTPNNETAKCISIDDCSVISRAIASLDADAIAFARASQCGYDNSPLVCCGSKGKYATPEISTTTHEPVYIVNPVLYPSVIKHLLLPDSTLCGLQINENTKVDANVTEVDEFPWAVALQYTSDYYGDTHYLCGGVLINKNYVLTAAQCLDIPGYTLSAVRLGEWKFSTPQDCIVLGREQLCTEPVDIEIEKQIPHIYYNKTRGSNNIALLRLQEPAVYSDSIRAICLAPNNHPMANAGDLMLSSTWGITKNGLTSDSKLKRRKTLVTNDVCTRSYPNATDIGRNRACYANSIDSDTCGDPGSSIIRKYGKSDYEDEEQFYLEGIIVGSNCKSSTKPCLYVRASTYTNWILTNLEA